MDMDTQDTSTESKQYTHTPLTALIVIYGQGLDDGYTTATTSQQQNQNTL